jgi:hypothetical protein
MILSSTISRAWPHIPSFFPKRKQPINGFEPPTRPISFDLKSFRCLSIFDLSRAWNDETSKMSTATHVNQSMQTNRSMQTIPTQDAQKTGCAFKPKSHLVFKTASSCFGQHDAISDSSLFVGQCSHWSVSK